jgi:hypothetical protein
MHLGEVPVGFEDDSLAPHLGSGLDGGVDPEPAPLFEFDDAVDDGDVGDLVDF